MTGGWLPWVLIVLGVLFLLEQFNLIDNIGQFWPLILIAIGLSMLVPGGRRMRRDERPPEPEPPAGPPEGQA